MSGYETDSLSSAVLFRLLNLALSSARRLFSLLHSYSGLLDSSESMDARENKLSPLERKSCEAALLILFSPSLFKFWLFHPLQVIWVSTKVQTLLLLPGEGRWVEAKALKNLKGKKYSTILFSSRPLSRPLSLPPISGRST